MGIPRISTRGGRRTAGHNALHVKSLDGAQDDILPFSDLSLPAGK